MAHPRKEIRHAVRDLLAAAATAAGDHVTATRIFPYRKGDLPAISVYTLEETIDEESAESAPRELLRSIDLEVAGFVHAGSAVDDAMDDLAEQIEAAMDADPTFGGKAADSFLRSTTMGLTGDGDTIAGMVTLTYDVTYRTTPADPVEDVDEFLTADVVHNPGGNVHPDDRAEDLINVRPAP
jgi:hypothetical protein